MTSDSIFFALVTYWHSAAELWSKTFAPLILPKKKILGQITWQRLKNKTKQKKQHNECSESSQHFGSRMCISHEGQATTLWRRLGYAQRVLEYRQLWAKKSNFVTQHPQQPKKKRQKSLSANILKGVVHPVILSTKVYTNNSGLPFCCQHSFSPNQKQH